MDTAWIIATAVLAYLLGSVSSAVIISRTFFGRDIREQGSGNAGATNMLRTHGKKMGVVTLICDVLKGVIAILFTKLAVQLGGGGSFFRLLPYIAGLFVVIGHNFPVFFKFRGGKGVATSLGVVFALNWQAALIVAALALAIMAITGYVSLGSIAAGIIYIAVDLSFMVFTDAFYFPELMFAVLIASLLIARHHANIKRLLNGTENNLRKKE